VLRQYASYDDSREAINKQLDELRTRIEQLDVITRESESNVCAKLEELSSGVAAQESAFNKRLGETESNVVGMCDKLDELSIEVATQETTFNKRLADALAPLESNVSGVCAKLDELSSAVAAQETTFNKRLTDALAQLSVQANESNSLVAELCAKVQSQETQLQKLMEEREVVPVEVPAESGAVVGAPATRSMLSRAAKAAGLL
jgi:chromosome segregation ATPase